MARDYDEMEDDNPIPEDYEENGGISYCLSCDNELGRRAIFDDNGEGFCDEDCELAYHIKLKKRKRNLDEDFEEFNYDE